MPIAYNKKRISLLNLLMNYISVKLPPHMLSIKDDDDILIC